MRWIFSSIIFLIMINFIREVSRGKSIRRSLMNKLLQSQVELKGRVLDLGGKGKPSYWRFLTNRKSSTVVYCFDIETDLTVDIVGSVSSLPLASECLDVVLGFNIFEHVSDIETGLREVRRVLRVKGRLHGYIPFLNPVHKVPEDYWRLTDAAIAQMLEASGFKDIKIIAQGGLFKVVFDMSSFLIRPRVFRGLLALCAYKMDLLLTKVVGQEQNEQKYVLGYYFQANN